MELRDQIKILRQRIAMQEELSGNAPTQSDRVIHAELAAFYRTHLEALERLSPQRFAGFS